jgi:hypothetical protein
MFDDECFKEAKEKVIPIHLRPEGVFHCETWSSTPPHSWNYDHTHFYPCSFCFGENLHNSCNLQSVFW